MLVKAVQSYIAMRRTCGFSLETDARRLNNFAAFSAAKDPRHIRSKVAIEWAGQGHSVCARARRLGVVIRCARYLRAQDPRHELPQAVFGPEQLPRPMPYIYSKEEIRRLLQAAANYGRHPLCGQTYSTVFGLLASTGLRVSEAIHLRNADVTRDGLVIRFAKFKKIRLVPLHGTVRARLEHYLKQRRRYAPFDDHVFISSQQKPLAIWDVERAFRSAAKKIGLRREPGQLPWPKLHALRHTFAVRALEACPADRDRITQHMVALSTYLGHCDITHTYWYLEATPQLMKDISRRCEHFFTGAQP